MEDTLAYIRDLLSAVGPNLVAATAVLFVGWLIAKIAAWSFGKGIDRIGFVKSANKSSDPSSPTLGASLGKAVYWVVILIALTMALGLLGMESIVSPFANMVDTFLSFLPSLIGAALIFGIGYIFASVARRAVTGVLAAAQIDKVLGKFGMQESTELQTIPNVIGIFVYVLILIPVSIASLDALRIDAISAPAIEMLNTILYAIPNIVVAGIVLLITILIARFVGTFLKQILPSFGVDKAFSRLALIGPEADSSLTGSTVIARIASVLVFLFGVIEAANLLQFETISSILADVLAIGGSVIFGAIIIAFGIWLSGVVARAVSSTGHGGAKSAAVFIQWSIIILGVSIGLRQMGLANEIIMIGFGLGLGAVALAGAIAFGFGGRDWAAKKLQEWGDK